MIAVGDITGDIVHDATDLSIASEAEGDLIARGAANWARLAAGTSGDVLTSTGASTVPTYQTPSVGGSDNIEYFTASGAGTWTAPAGVTEAMVTIVGAGGGGGGGGGANFGDFGGGGGGGGEVSLHNVFSVTPGNTYNFVIGAGGGGGVHNSGNQAGDNGVAGGSTTFTGDTAPTDQTITAVGGNGGAGGGNGTGGQGGSGGGADVIDLDAGVHDVAFKGGAGGVNITNRGGAGGSTYLTLAIEDNTGAGAGVPEGDGILGGGAQGANSIVNGGNPPNSPGGGDGGDGMVIISYGS